MLSSTVQQRNSVIKTFTFFFIFFTTVVYHGLLNIVPWALQKDFVCPSCISSSHLLTQPPTPSLPRPLRQLQSVLYVNLFLCHREVHLCHILEPTYKWYHTVFVFVWFLSMIISRSIHVAEHGIISFFSWMSNIPLYRCIPRFLYPLICQWTFRWFLCLLWRVLLWTYGCMYLSQLWFYLQNFSSSKTEALKYLTILPHPDISSPRKQHSTSYFLSVNWMWPLQVLHISGII